MRNTATKEQGSYKPSEWCPSEENMRTVKCGIDVLRLIREKGEATLWDLELLMPNFLEEKISADLKEEQLRHEEKQPRSQRKKISTKHTAWTRQGSLLFPKI